ncbi:putative BTB/POZ domain-containing protein [Septoria linicola]|nr:putative BTB/POZ domain-containing protein [Septoria linicola]
MADDRKRPASHLESASESEHGKRSRLSYGPTIAITISMSEKLWHQFTRSGRPQRIPITQETFHVHRDLLADHSPFFQDRFQEDGDPAECLLTGLDLQHFKVYLDWLYNGRLGGEAFASSGSSMLGRLLAVSKDDFLETKRESIVLYRLIGLLKMNKDVIRDHQFECRVRKALEQWAVSMIVRRLENRTLPPYTLSLEIGGLLWSPRGSPLFKTWVGATLAGCFTRADVEAARHTLPPDLLKVLRRRLHEGLWWAARECR